MSPETFVSKTLGTCFAVAAMRSCAISLATAGMVRHFRYLGFHGALCTVILYPDLMSDVLRYTALSRPDILISTWYLLHTGLSIGGIRHGTVTNVTFSNITATGGQPGCTQDEAAGGGCRVKCRPNSTGPSPHPPPSPSPTSTPPLSPTHPTTHPELNRDCE
jgi:hypothetical protein